MISCISNQIALYSPHTSFDAIDGGVNDWLLKPFGRYHKFLSTGCFENCKHLRNSADLFFDKPKNHFTKGSGDTKPLEVNDSGVGPGRFIALQQSLHLNEAIEKLKTHLRLPHLRLALGVHGDKGTNISYYENKYLQMVV